jgi:hypothetical protein
MMRKLAILSMAALTLAGCATGAKTRDIRLAQLDRIEAAARAIDADIVAGAYDPAKYDLYLMLNRSLFDQLLGGFAGVTSQFTLDGRAVSITFDKLALDFSPGSPTATIAATAKDLQRNIQVSISLDAQLLIEGDPASPGALFLKPMVTSVEPSIAIGKLDVTRARFVRALIALKITEYTEKLPMIALPLDRAFAMGGPGGTRPTGRIDTGNGSWIEGDLTFPGTQVSGKLSVARILFLGNGVHLFANVEGL